jgi:hypothetical protein|tara:strand:+ start:437 stop:832 length:396 start_codon:yes stop_codon:yes gene_type:complete
MLEKMLQDDEIGNFLMKNIKLSKVQLDTLLITIADKQEISLNKMILKRDNRVVSKGSFNRTLKQAKKNVEISLFTIIALEYFSIIEKNHIINLIKIADTLKKISGNKLINENVITILDQLSYALTNVYNKK